MNPVLPLPFHRRPALALSAGLALLACFAAGAAPGQSPESTPTPGLPYTWAQPQAKVLPTGDLEWAPQPHTFQAGSTVRYIDFDKGDDAAPGTKERPWKHHPWDTEAKGEAAKFTTAPATYVFKGGVAYRGKLNARASGTAAEPIRLTSDPSWGTGYPLLYGSRAIEGVWKRATAADAPAGMPEPEKVWMIDLPKGFDTDPIKARISALWLVDGAKASLLNIARDPNYAVSDPIDPTKDWYRWDAFDGPFQPAAGWLIDKRWKDKPADFFKGAVVWTQHRNLMGVPHKVTPTQFDPARGAFKIASPGGAQYRTGGDPKVPFKLDGRVGYFIENVPAFLDSPGEYFADNHEDSTRLFVRLADGIDPNKVRFEVGVTRSPIEIRDQSHIEVSGLHFSFNDPDDGTYGYPWYVGVSPAVRIVGSCRSITVRACRFTDVASAVVAFPRPGGEGGSADARKPDIGVFKDDVMGDIAVLDNDVLNSQQNSAIWIAGESQRNDGKPWAVLDDVRVLRNRVRNNAFRTGGSPTDPNPAIRVDAPRAAELAGNIVDGSWGAGVFVLAGKHTGAFNTVHLSRVLVHHNKVENTMLAINDYGGLEAFQGGPVYFYNNISRNAVGSRTFTGTRLAYNLYLDGGFKIYAFNNILDGRDPDPALDEYGHCGYFTVFGFLNNFWNNTVHRFEYGVNGSSGNRSTLLGNVFNDMSKTFIGQNRPGDVSMLGGGDTGEMGARGIATMAYDTNVFFGKPKNENKNLGSFGFVGGVGDASTGKATVYAGETREELAKALAGMGARLSDLGVHSDTPPLRNPEKRDFRPAPNGATKDRGVKFFAPWALARVVGEWHFLQSKTAPATVVGENFFMQRELLLREMYYFVPRNDLTVQGNVTPADYVAGPLEDWIPGALTFDGKTRFASLAHADLVKDMEYPASIGEDGRAISGAGKKGKKAKPGAGETTPFVIKGSERETVDMGVNNFALEIMFRTEPGHTAGVLVAKGEERGYQLTINKTGALSLDLLAGPVAHSLATPKPVNDGRWHHAIAEVDRKGETVLYLDGKKVAAQKTPLAPTESLSNTEDFLVGKAPAGHFFAGAIDFLRVSRATLAESLTNIDELYAWEFDGPALRDFAGNAPRGPRRDAGALEGE